MSEIPNLRRKLDMAEPDVRAYVKHLERTNRRLQAQTVSFNRNTLRTKTGSPH